jgi:hypothetical protein
VVARGLADALGGEGVDGERELVDAARRLHGEVEAVADRFQRLGGAGAEALGESAALRVGSTDDRYRPGSR